LHGCDQSHDKIKEFGNLVPTAEANGIVVAVPSVGAEASGPGCWDYHLAKDRREHIAELISLANNLKTRAALNIGPNHVYIVGLSSGAAMALDVGCAAPDVFAGMGAIAGPSVGSDQDNKALADASLIPRTNVDNAIENCRSLAGNKESDFATQITSITFGDMDKNAPNKQFDFSLFDDAFNRAHAGQLALVSKKWSDENVEVMQKIYGTGSLGPKEAVQNGLGTQQEAEKDDKARISLLVVHNVGHA
jgi:poly(3-hydroxybutyrate) depolymerase